MSYILEALKKSEQQREIGRVPGITSVHENTAKSVSGKWLWLIAAILLLNAGLLVFLLWPETEPEPEPVAMTTPLREAVPPRRDRPVAALPGQPTAVEKPVPRVSQSASIEPPPAPLAAETLKNQSEAKPLPEETVTAAAVSPPAPQVEQARVEQQPTPVVKAEVPNLPVWPQIPSHLFQQLGSNLRLDVHVFSDQPKKSFVLINMRKYRAGEKLQEGPQLDEVTAEGVILSFRGQRFRLQAQ
jgi:general secretion pathway protein B